MGGIVTDLDGRALAAPVRGRRVRLHRACTARTGSRRTRSASASSSAAVRRSPRSTTPSPRTTARRSPRTSARPPARRARPCGCSPASSARAENLERLREDPYPLARLVAASALHRRRDARRPRPRRVPGHRPGPRRPPHDPRPRHGDPALRGMDGLLIDWGGVLTTSVFALVRRVLPPVRDCPRTRSATRSAATRRPPAPDRPRVAARSTCRSSSAGSPTRCDLDARRPRPAPDGRRRAPTTRCATPSSASTTRASRPRSCRNSWNADDYDAELRRDVRRRRALPAASKIRKPGPRDLRSGARTRRTSRRACRVRR